MQRYSDTFDQFQQEITEMPVESLCQLFNFTFRFFRKGSSQVAKDRFLPVTHQIVCNDV